MFIGRKKELTELNNRYNMNTKQFGIIYGRRRIGKSALIDKFLDQKEGIIFQAKQDNSYGNLKSFSYTINKLINFPKKYIFSSWEEALDSLVQHYNGKRFILAIDEYPYIVSQDKSFPSVIQDFIDHAPDNVFLLLSGSNISFLKKEINDEKSPLYKRKTFSMEIKQMYFEEAIQFLTPYNPVDKCSFLAIMGGCPYYLSAIDTTKSFEENIKTLIINEYGIFFELPYHMLSNATKCQDVYNAILQSIAKRHRKLSEISAHILEESAKVSKYIDTLISIDILEKCNTYNGGKKSNYYKIIDPMLRFWYTIIFDNQEKIRLNQEVTYNTIKKDITDFVNYGFEDVCHMYIDYLNRHGKLDKLYPPIKNYIADNSKLGRSVEIDGVAEEGTSLLIIDCKFRNKSYSSVYYEHLKESASVFSPKYTKNYYIFSKSGFADDMDSVNDAVKVSIDDMFII